MLEESVASTPSLWATMHSWFSPAVLFILLNVMIGTIAITSTLTSNKTPQQQQQQEQEEEEAHQNTSKPQNLTKSPSMLERLKSFNFYSKPQEEEPTTPSPTYEQNPEINHLFSFPEPHEHGHELEGFHVHAQHLELGETQEAEVEQEKDKPLSPRSPSILDKIKSFRLYSPISPEPTSPKSNITHFTLDPDQEQHEKEEDELEEEEEGQSIDDEVYLQGHQHVVSRTKSDTKPTAGETLQKLPTKIRKSASEKSGFAHFEVEQDDNVENRRPASVKEGKSKGNDVDEEVDAKADDFINRFKHQLKLQRIDSFTRYKEMISRGSSK